MKQAEVPITLGGGLVRLVQVTLAVQARQGLVRGLILQILLITLQDCETPEGILGVVPPNKGEEKDTEATPTVMDLQIAELSGGMISTGGCSRTTGMTMIPVESRG